jgi:hypothetical protein
MTQETTQKNKVFAVSDAKVNWENLEDDNPEIRRIRCELVDSSEILYLYPRDTIKREQSINGLDGDTEETVKYTAQSLPERFRELVKKSGDRDDDKIIQITSTVQKIVYDDGGTVYRAYQNMMDSDSFYMELVDRQKTSETEESESQEPTL